MATSRKQYEGIGDVDSNRVNRNCIAGSERNLSKKNNKNQKLLIKPLKKFNKI